MFYLRDVAYKLNGLFSLEPKFKSIRKYEIQA